MKSKALRITVDLVLIILGIVFLVFGIKDLIVKINESKTPDNIMFSKSYTNVSTDNNFKYISDIESTDGMIFIGLKTDAWSQVLAPILDNIAHEKNITIYYYEIKDGSETPKITFREDGKEIITFNKDDIFDEYFEGAPIEYFTEENITSLKEILDDYIK